MNHVSNDLARISLLALWLVACGGETASETGAGPDSEGEAADGVTACGDVDCMPGTHCVDTRVGQCDEGCVNDDNCLEEQRCDTDAFLPACVARDGATSGGAGGADPGDPLAACQAGCEHFQTCGLPAAEAAACRTDCGGLTADQQTAIGACGDVACTAVPGCLGVDCLGDDACSSGTTCVDFTCQ